MIKLLFKRRGVGNQPRAIALNDEPESVLEAYAAFLNCIEPTNYFWVEDDREHQN